MMTKGPVAHSSLVELLTGLGWSPTRRQNTDQVVSAWAGRGYEASDAAMEFVAQFDGISFNYPRHVAVGGIHECVLDAIRATGAIKPTTVRGYEERTGRKLAPVGLAASNHVLLMVADTGQVFGGYDDFLGLYGEEGKITYGIFSMVLTPYVSRSAGRGGCRCEPPAGSGSGRRPL